MGIFRKIKDAVKDGIIYALEKAGEVAGGIPPIRRINDSKNINANAKTRSEKFKRKLSNMRSDSQRAFENYGKLKIKVYDESIRTFVNLFRHLKKVELTKIKSTNKTVNTTLSVIKMQKTDFEYIDGVKAIVSGTGAGAVSGAVVFGAVSTFGAASTGTAIAGLSGAAATNATLAWLGGGSLAAGGGGIFVGTAVLGGLVAIPVFIVGGLILNAKSKEMIEKARANKAKADKFVSECETAISALEVIKERTSQLNNLLTELDKIFRDQLVILEELINYYKRKNIFEEVYYKIKRWIGEIASRLFSIENTWKTAEKKANYKKFKLHEKEKVMVTVTLAQTLKNILDTDILDSDGNATDKSLKTINEGKHLLSSTLQ